ncbi:hypothetical protein MKZ38_002905 [Zalerion maritima]|uniref:Actin cytoskeleton-regulatory complex protein SLA1 n=1 Tax=Zalerion maritima TaxID=339359 RepID=A0AAD5RNC3_9PEZI|nr:hypothetical protein MKZ38_002905 [Zalerion maritima]
MGFIGVYRAIYDYAPQAEGELAITDGDLLFVLEKNGDDDWWKAKKKAAAEDEDEPIGLIPNNYIEEAKPICYARALYEYTRQTEEELSFPEDANLMVFDTSDPDWILVGLDGDYGFVPANYIEMPRDEEAGDASQEVAPPPALPTRPPTELPSSPLPSPPQEIPASSITSAAAAASGPAATLAAAMGGRSATTKKPSVSFSEEPPATINSPPALPRRDYASTESPEQHEEEPVSPPLPSRPVPRLEPREAPTRTKSPPIPIRAASRHEFDTVNPSPLSPGGFRLYHINEMVSVMGKRKKMPTTLGVNLSTGIIMIAPEKAQDGPTQEWTGDRMTHYSREGKHVFLELVKPSKSIDFHAGAKDTAEEIVSALGELAGAIKAEGLLEVIAAGKSKGQKKGVVLYEFRAQGQDEVSVDVDDEVIILDDRLSEEWWKVRRIRSGKEGVVPSSYVEVTGTVLPSPASSGINSGRSMVEQNRLEEKRLAREALKNSRASEVGVQASLPERGSSLSSTGARINNSGQRGIENGPSGGSPTSSSRPRPDPSKVRAWTDRSKSFSVDAQFLGLKDGKINLHKMNGVKIAVPVAKMSVEDLNFVEKMTGQSLQDKPRGDRRVSAKSATESSRSKVGASVQPRKPDYDWFQFFLSCDVAVGLCDRYAQAFVKDSMDESVLPDVDASVLRNLGLREGDIIKVMRFLDNKYGRTKNRKEGEGEGGLFAGEGGKLKNNTRKGRPTPTNQASDVVDPKAFSKDDGEAAGSAAASSSSPTQENPKKPSSAGGFDDDAWDVKPARPQPAPSNLSPKVEEQPKPVAVASAPPPTQLTGGMQELSLLSQPLESIKPQPTAPAPLQQPAATDINSQPTQLPGASASVFNAVASLSTSPAAQARARPTPPSGTPTQGGGLMPPPPPRPLSAPQVTGPSQFGAPSIMPQMTGVQGQVAPPGQSLNDITQNRLQQQIMQQQEQIRQMQQQQPMQPGFMVGQPTGIMRQHMTGIQSPFGPQQTGQMPQGPGMMGPQATGVPGQYSVSGPINSFLPSPLEPQRTAMPTGPPSIQRGGAGSFGSGQPPQQQGSGMLQPLTAQKTGPPPPIRFGMQNEAKLTPQATGRRANLAQATPENPFGF